MRWLVLLAACNEHGSTPPIPDAPIGMVEFHGACAFPLAADGAVAFPDTVVNLQTPLRPIDLVNVLRDLDPAESFMFSIEGPDAAEFTVTTDYSTDPVDMEMCGHHQGLGPSPFVVGASCRVDLYFKPTTLGAKQAALHVHSLATSHATTLDQTLALRGTAVDAPTGLVASMPDIYVRPVAPGGSESVTLTNRNAASIAVGDPVFSTGFGIAGAPMFCPATLAAGATCTIGSLSVSTLPSGCPMGSLTTTTHAITIPLTARLRP
jgi:hypothetical protein